MATGKYSVKRTGRFSYSGNIATSGDTNFSQVSLLLHGDGSNAANNNTFLDSSTNNLTVTKSGTGVVTQGSASPFPLTVGQPYSLANNGGSVYFADASTNYITVPASSNFAYGLGDFSIECWVNLSSFSGSPFIYAQTVSGTNYFVLGIDATGKATWVGTSSGAGTNITSLGSITINTWCHIAACRVAGMVTVYVNGIGGTPTANTMNFTDTTYIPTIGRYTHSGVSNFVQDGYVSNLRIIKNSSAYTANFTPSTAPLTNASVPSTDSNFASVKTLCPLNDLLDYSTGATTTVSNSGATISASTSKFGSNSLFFDGNTNTTLFSNSSYAFGTGDFTMEFWVYFPSLPNNGEGLFQYTYTGAPTTDYINSNTFSISFGASGIILYTGGGGGRTSTQAVTTGVWQHWAYVRNAGSVYLYINGTNIPTFTNVDTYNYTATGIVFGAYYGVGTTRNSTFYLQDLKVTAGLARYTANFTAPTSPASYAGKVQLLLSGTNAAIYDNAAKVDVSTMGNAATMVAVNKFGGSSIGFDGTSYLSITGNSSNLVLSNGDFTIEMWIYMNSTAAMDIIDFRPTSTNGLYVSLGTSVGGTMYLYVSAANVITASTPISATTWTHVALCKAANVTKLFLNGTQTGSSYTDNNTYVTPVGRPYIGAPSTTGIANFNGYIDDLRITKGIARYTSNFSIPVSAFPNY